MHLLWFIYIQIKPINGLLRSEAKITTTEQNSWPRQSASSLQQTAQTPHQRIVLFILPRIESKRLNLQRELAEGHSQPPVPNYPHLQPISNI